MFVPKINDKVLNPLKQRLPFRYTTSRIFIDGRSVITFLLEHINTTMKSYSIKYILYYIGIFIL